MMYDCDFRYASDTPTIVNFTMDLGKAMYYADVDAVNGSTTGMFWAYHIIGLRKYHGIKVVKTAWGVSA